MNRYTLSFLLFGFVLLAFHSCKKLDSLDDLELSEQDAEYALPLFQTSASLQDFLEEFDSTTQINVGPDGDITLNYKGKVTARTSDEIFEVANSVANIPFPVLDTFMAVPFAIPNGIDIDYAILKKGNISWFYQSNHTEDVRVVVNIPNLIDPNGEEFSVTRNLTYNSVTGPIQFPELNLPSLKGYTVRPTNDSIFIRYDLYRKDTQVRDTLAYFIMRIDSLNASYLEGYLGDDIYELDRDTIEIDFFENWTRGDVYFADPLIKLTVENSFGFPVRSKANLVNVMTVNNELLPLRSSFIDNGINVDFPSLQEIGEVKVTEFAFDRENSNIDSILAAGPTAVDYDFDAIPNPDQDTTIRGFITDSSYLQALVEVDLPILGKTNGFAVRDTFEVDFGSYDDVKEIEFKLVTENEIPLAVGVQLYFADAAGTILDSLFEKSTMIIEGAPVDMEGNAIDKSKLETFIPFDGARFDQIRKATQLYLSTSFSTTNQGQDVARVLATQKTFVRMGMKIKI